MWDAISQMRLTEVVLQLEKAYNEEDCVCIDEPPFIVCPETSRERRRRNVEVQKLQFRFSVTFECNLCDNVNGYVNFTTSTVKKWFERVSSAHILFNRDVVSVSYNGKRKWYKPTESSYRRLLKLWVRSNGSILENNCRMFNFGRNNEVIARHLKEYALEFAGRLHEPKHRRNGEDTKGDIQ